MLSRNYLNTLSLVIAGVGLAGLLAPGPLSGQSREPAKPGSRASAPAPRAKAPSGRTATPRAATPRQNDGDRRPAATRPQDSGDSNRRAGSDSNDRERQQRVAPPQTDGRDRGDRPAEGVAVPRSPRGPQRPHVPRYRYPYYAYGYPYGYGYGYSPYDSYLYDPFFSGYPGYGYGIGYLGGYSTYAYGSGGQSSSSFGDGGLRLKVKPRSAEVLVDGYYVGRVDDFDGVFQRLEIEPGPHRIEIRHEGYRTLSFDVRIPLDDTITYRAELERTTP